MTFSSKYDIGEEVYFYNAKTCKVEIGTIESIGLFANEDGCNFNYHIKSKSNGSFMAEYVSGSLVFKDRDDVFRFVYSIAENI